MSNTMLYTMIVGKLLTTIGLTTGALNLLSGDAPLILAVIGVIVMYFGIFGAFLGWLCRRFI